MISAPDQTWLFGPFAQRRRAVALVLLTRLWSRAHCTGTSNKRQAFDSRQKRPDLSSPLSGTGAAMIRYAGAGSSQAVQCPSATCIVSPELVYSDCHGYRTSNLTFRRLLRPWLHMRSLWQPRKNDEDEVCLLLRWRPELLSPKKSMALLDERTGLTPEHACTGDCLGAVRQREIFGRWWKSQKGQSVEPARSKKKDGGRREPEEKGKGLTNQFKPVGLALENKQRD